MAETLEDLIKDWPLHGTIQVSTFDGRYLNDEIGVDDLKRLARQQRAEVIDEFVRRATDYAQSIPWNDRVDKSAALGIAILVAREMKEAYERKT